MDFVDEITFEVHAGDGGDGSHAMRHEKNKPLGGPAGGDGGNGGDVVLETDPRLTTLLDLKHRRIVKADPGEHGRGNDQYGRGGKSLVVRVPLGTQVFDADGGALLCDLDTPGEHTVIARGGRGGRGNLHFVTPSERAPLRADPGRQGEHRRLRLELKLLADVGIVGFPNVGKSTFIASVSRSRAKVADYPFTTLVPNLGVVWRGEERGFVLADIPGIIEGAAEGAGLGHRFLKHVERTRVLLHLVTLDPTPGREPLADYDILLAELERFDKALSKRPSVVTMSKLDLPDVREAFGPFRDALKTRGVNALAFSAATGEGVPQVLDAVERLLGENPITPTPRATSLQRKPSQVAVQQPEQVDDDAHDHDD